MSDLKERDSLYIANTYSRFPIEIKSGKGSLIYDENDKEYIDMGAGIAVNTFGIADEKWIKAVEGQLGLYQHTSNLYYTSPCVELAEKLCKRTGLKKVFFGNSGAEANECAIKVARKYAADKKGKDYNKIITLVNSFHGRTIATLAATGQDVFHNDFGPFPEGFLYAPANDLDAIKELVKNNKVAAVMFECIQGEGGVLPLDISYVTQLEQFCKENDILLIVDEVQTGNGRTGSLYAYMCYQIKPDIVTTAKGLGGGLPIGACMLGEKVENVLGAGSHGSTFGANPAICAGACNILDRITDGLLEEVRLKSYYITSNLMDQKGIESVTGMGLMIGVKTVKPAKEVVNKCIEKGVIFLTAKDKVRLLPALNIPVDLLKKAIQTLLEVCAED